MYVREHSGSGKDEQAETLTLAVSGKLWNRSLVMVDTETESLWSHLLGKAMEGELKGTVLETLPATMVSWQSWKADHPATTVTASGMTTSSTLAVSVARPVARSMLPTTSVAVPVNPASTGNTSNSLE